MDGTRKGRDQNLHDDFGVQTAADQSVISEIAAANLSFGMARRRGSQCIDREYRGEILSIVSRVMFQVVGDFRGSVYD